MNFWRPITTVYRTPLALCDASTVSADDLHPSEVRGGLDDSSRPPLHGFNLSYNPAHRWYFVHHMRPDEMFAFKLYDSDASQPQVDRSYGLHGSGCPGKRTPAAEHGSAHGILYRAVIPASHGCHLARGSCARHKGARTWLWFTGQNQD